MNEWTQIMANSEILAHNRMLLDRLFRRANCGEIDVLCRCTAFADPQTGRARRKCTNSE